MSAAVTSRFASQLAAQQRERMPAEGEAQRAVIGDDVLAFGRRGQGGRRSVERRAGAGKDRRQLLHAGDFPYRVVPMAGERGKRAGGGERGEVAAVELARGARDRRRARTAAARVRPRCA